MHTEHAPRCDGGHGSSPHTRGAPCPIDPYLHAVRIIPAYAGCTWGQHRRRLGRSDHPRIRGVHCPLCAGLGELIGSSPHTRGALGEEPFLEGVGGDHPRIRGVHSGRIMSLESQSGSSPHTRGARTATGVSGRRAADHPRIRGVHTVLEPGAHALFGSSPHTRGARRTTGSSSPRARDHPRIRGVHAPVVSIPYREWGSSPHTRGAPYPMRYTDEQSGIIPAYAGCTTSDMGSGGWHQDHPRIRGVHASSAPSIDARRGSSPHTRGARPEEYPGEDHERIIPAYAGCTATGWPAAAGAEDHPRIRGVHRVWRETR